MTPTPTLREFNSEGGTLYVFPSVSRDLTRTFVSSDYEFKFSHFACLNLQGDFWNSGSDIQNHLQNYVMNFENAILNGMGMEYDYDNDILTSPAEKVFFNWLQKVGEIKFKEDSTIEDCDNIGQRVVQYIGNLDIMNTVEVNGDTFEELYIYIPSSVGASTDVYFRRGELTDDKNYLDREYILLDSDIENLQGNRTDGEKLPLFYDNIDGENSNVFSNNSKTYVGDIGHTIDFRDSSYDGGEGINNMNAKSQENFTFNAILIYYDLLQKSKTPGVKKVTTNLYGILFFGMENGILKPFPKIKERVYGGGTSFGFKIDMKIDTVGDIIGQLVEVSPENTSALSLYERSLVQLQKCIDIFYTQKVELTKLSERVSKLENLLTGIESVQSLRSDINRLYNIFDGNLMVDTTALLGLIDENSKRLDKIMNGGTDLKLQYDMDVLQPGRGIGMTKSLNKVIISSEDRYSINDVTNSGGALISEENPITTSGSTKKECNIQLRPGENFAVIYIRDDGLCETQFSINIDDSEYNWEIGQSIRIYFSGDMLNFGDDGLLEIHPTSTVTISVAEFDDGATFIELVCVGENKFVYLIR